jgi:hypothetical protein
MTCSLVVVFERAATAWEIVVYCCRLPTVRASGGAFVRLAARAREMRVRKGMIIFILVVDGSMSWTMVGNGSCQCHLLTFLYSDRTSQRDLQSYMN